MVDIPSVIPDVVDAGDTVSWKRSFPDYKASDGWALSYTLIGSAAVESFAADADGEDFIVTIAATDSADWSAGRYRLVEFVTKGSERYTLGRTMLTVNPNLAAANAPIDVRTHARKVLDAIEAWLESRAPTAAMFELAGRRIQNYALSELLSLRDKYRAEVQREEAAANGKLGSRLRVRF